MEFTLADRVLQSYVVISIVTHILLAVVFICKWLHHCNQPAQEVVMANVNDFAIEVSAQEGLKKQMNIAQVKEILKVVNGLLDGKLYKMIRNEHRLDYDRA